MISETEMNGRDSVKLNLLREVISGECGLKMQLDAGAREDYAAALHREESRMCVYGGFNLSEDPSGETLTIRPVAAGQSLKVFFRVPDTLSGKKASVFSRAEKAVVQEYDITAALLSLELMPHEGQYAVRLTYADPDGNDAPEEQSDEARELTRLETRIAEREREQALLRQRQRSAAEYLQKLERIEAECHKDYETLESEIEEYKARMKADSSVIAYYRDRDVAPVEELLREIGEKLWEAEAQIRLFIEAGQKKTMEIESEIKFGGKK